MTTKTRPSLAVTSHGGHHTVTVDGTRYTWDQAQILAFKLLQASCSVEPSPRPAITAKVAAEAAHKGAALNRSRS